THTKTEKKKNPPRQRQPDPTKPAGWTGSVKDIPPIPYRLVDIQEVLTCEQRIVIVEGEGKADLLAQMGVYATCNAGGAGKWTSEHSEYLRGADVVIMPDNDEPGERHATSVAASLLGVAKRVRILELPDLDRGDDIANWLKAGGTRQQLDALIEGAPEARLPYNGPRLASSGEVIRAFAPPAY